MSHQQPDQMQGYTPAQMYQDSNYPVPGCQLFHPPQPVAVPAMPTVKVAIPSPLRVYNLEKVIGHRWRDKELAFKASTRRIKDTDHDAYPDDLIIDVDIDAPEVLILDRLTWIGDSIFAAEMHRGAYMHSRFDSEFQGLLRYYKADTNDEGLLEPFRTDILDNDVLPANKAIMGAILVDGGLQAVAKAMPYFYRKPGSDPKSTSTKTTKQVANQDASKAAAKVSEKQQQQKQKVSAPKTKPAEERNNALQQSVIAELERLEEIEKASKLRRDHS